MSKKIIVPQGLINPNETTIIEIPSGVGSFETLIARVGPNENRNRSAPFTTSPRPHSATPHIETTSRTTIYNINSKELVNQSNSRSNSPNMTGCINRPRPQDSSYGGGMSSKSSYGQMQSWFIPNTESTRRDGNFGRNQSNPPGFIPQVESNRSDICSPSRTNPSVYLPDGETRRTPVASTRRDISFRPKQTQGFIPESESTRRADASGRRDNRYGPNQTNPPGCISNAESTRGIDTSRRVANQTARTPVNTNRGYSPMPSANQSMNCSAYNTSGRTQAATNNTDFMPMANSTRLTAAPNTRATKIITSTTSTTNFGGGRPAATSTPVTKVYRRVDQTSQKPNTQRGEWPGGNVAPKKYSSGSPTTPATPRLPQTPSRPMRIVSSETSFIDYDRTDARTSSGVDDNESCDICGNQNDTGLAEDVQKKLKEIEAREKKKMNSDLQVFQEARRRLVEGTTNMSINNNSDDSDEYCSLECSTKNSKKR